ncbi:YchJ family protein [Catenovulum maritimum]|uniref:YchJ-like middle NTF2-like domain-containing protein n=1 Tax=Catenovulum maritimum TaxID=1513271 RepID=A0A0J8JLC5_9ALTE|nr:YchJ family metal-binding protein [Catenovulum maritimum]KMT65361.1 hypothetical protein XM47_10070 [Catenovulum maritimum]
MKCPCNSEKPFSVCCEPYLTNKLKAENAEVLMRSRYTAYHQKHISYLVDTQHKSTHSEHIAEEIQAFADQAKFIKLTVIKHEVISLAQQRVEFEARYIIENTLFTMREISNFTMENNLWYYLDGQLNSKETKLSKNAVCPCGKGKKYKRCCIV